MSAIRGCKGEAAAELHVLAVDDSSVDRRLIERLLRASSYRVTTVDSGKRALELLGLGKENNTSSKGPKVNMIITDYCMPGMTGYDLLKVVKESSALREIPVVIVSSENEGAEDFLLKPLRPADVSRLRSRIDGSTS
ncbi:unnamed protein product [Spirodela intermedia]|uniref:Response regulatory domain-containing protein n=1 Tax=Spirodela intermedia TaxID=51605 RepID=A0A7I8L062_SPIIN|nr:unnamed protein product [Spirodela intermedia]